MDCLRETRQKWTHRDTIDDVSDGNYKSRAGKLRNKNNLAVEIFVVERIGVKTNSSRFVVYLPHSQQLRYTREMKSSKSSRLFLFRMVDGVEFLCSTQRSSKDTLRCFSNKVLYKMLLNRCRRSVCCKSPSHVSFLTFQLNNQSSPTFI